MTAKSASFTAESPQGDEVSVSIADLTADGTLPLGLYANCHGCSATVNLSAAQRQELIALLRACTSESGASL